MRFTLWNYIRNVNSRILLLLFSCFFAFSLNAQEAIQVEGKIFDESNEALPGATVTVKGTTTGAVTDLDGNYRITARSNDTLVYSFVGMAIQEQRVGNRTSIDVVLLPDVLNIDEIVVVGYGTMKKSDVTGAIVSVRGDDIANVKSSNALEALQGKAAGVDIVRSSGRAGSGYDILIRGSRSLNATNKPIYIVDGINYGSDININPNDIESIEILKDASTTAIYGSEGANGVILVSTKRGKAGQPKVAFNAYYGITQPFGNQPFSRRDDYLRFQADLARVRYDDWDMSDSLALTRRGFSTSMVEGIENGTDTDWEGLLFEDQGSQQDYHLSILGGSETTNYNLSINYFNEDGYIAKENFDRYTIRGNMETDVGERFTFGLNTILSTVINERGENPVGDVAAAIPILPALDSMGNVLAHPDPSDQTRNPLTEHDINYRRVQYRSTRAFASVFGRVNILENLSFQTTFNGDLRFRTQNEFNKPHDDIVGIDESSASFANDYGITWTNLLNYTYSNANHAVTVTAGAELRYSRGEDFGFSAQTLALLDSWWWPIPSASGEKVIDQGRTLVERQLASYFGRVHYGFQGKYLFTGTFRYDGASQLAEGHKWDFFPSAAVGWRISEEDFMANANAISNLKLRLSYGVSGNRAIDPYGTFGSTIVNPLYYQFGVTEAPAPGFRSAQVQNPELGWEKSRSFNLGADYGFFRNRLSGSIEVYTISTDNILLERKLAPSSAITTAWQNIGETSGKGIEFTLNADIVSTSQVSWKTNFSFAYNKNKIESLYSGLEQDLANEWFVGEPLRVHYGYQMDGIYQEEDLEEAVAYGREVGQMRFFDANGDSVTNADDRVIIGPVEPIWSGGFNSVVSYKGFDFSFFIHARMGHIVSDGTINSWVPDGKGNTFDRDYWTPTSRSTRYPRPEPTEARQSYQEKEPLSWVDGSYIKLRDISLVYNFSSSLLSKTFISRLQIYASVKNAAVLWAPMWQLDGGNNRYDPELEGSNSWPTPRMFIIGLKSEF